MIMIAYNWMYGTLERLYFVGLDEEKHPMWLTLKPGEPIVNTANSERSLGRQDYYHLCLEGEEASASEIVRLLGLALELRPRDFARAMMENLRKLRAPKKLIATWKKKSPRTFNDYSALEDEPDDNEDKQIIDFV